MWLVLAMLSSCDHSVYLDIFIENSCDEIIKVECVAGTYDAVRQNISINIEPYKTELLYQGETIMGVSKEDIPYFIKELKIKKGKSKMIFDPLDTERWSFEEIEKYQSKTILTVNPEDFE
jgi:hypothetical protein